MLQRKIELFLLVAVCAGASFFASCKSGAPETAQAPPAEQLSAPTLELKGPATAEKTVAPPPAPPPAPSPVTEPPTIPAQPAAEAIEPKTPESETPEVPYQPHAIQSGVAIDLLIDGSGSMNGLLGTASKAELLKTMLGELMQQWSSIKETPLQIAVRTFGSQFPTEANQCDDTQRLVGLGALDREKTIEALSKWKPQGGSPISAALEQAASDFPDSAQIDRVILLVADGGDTCHQDPCQTAKKLYDAPNKIITHVIAFDSEEPTLKCIAQNGHGEFILARTAEELMTGLDQAFRTTAPYNLKLKVYVGGSPLPTTLTIYKAGSQEIFRQEQSYGTQLLRLPAGSYDIRVEYSASIEISKPAKILKGVDLTASGKVEQEVRFDLASVAVSGADGEGHTVSTRTDFFVGGQEKVFASLTTNGEETHFYLTPGTYNLVGTRLEPEANKMTLTEPNVVLTGEQGLTKQFIFQTGTLVLKGMNSQKQATPLLYRVTRVGDANAVLASGTAEATGSSINLPPGNYDVWVEGQDPVTKVPPHGQLKNITIEAGKNNEQSVVLITGILNLKATKGANDPAAAEFQVTDPANHTPIATITAEKGEASVALTPGKYDIKATYLGSGAIEKPTAEASAIVIEEGKIKDQTLQFQLGTLKILGRNVKEQKVPTTFYVMKAGTEDLVDQMGPVTEWTKFDLPPGIYDIKAEDDSLPNDKPYVSIMDVNIDAGNDEVREAVFTNAKVKLIGRGKNNQIIKVQFKIFRYGSDTELFSGTTGDDWTSYSIPPANYYLEAGWTDKETDQLLKKWITLKINENEIVEKVLQF